MSKQTHTPRAPVHVDGLIQKLVHYVAEHRIRITDFLKSDDIHNLGCISVDQFHRALTATGFRIDSREAEAVAHRFIHPRHPGSVDWVAFANKIESNFVVPDLERAPRSDPTGSYESKGRLAAKELSPEREEEMNNLLARIQREITRARMTPKQYFQDFDRVRVNRITRLQFQRALAMTRMPLSSRDYELLWTRFEISPDQVDYHSFCNRVVGQTS